jgi:hypothetical protein
LIQAFDWAEATTANIDLLATFYGTGSAFGEPSSDFGKIPNHAPCGQCETARKLTPLLHPEDGAVRQRDDLLELTPPDRPWQSIQLMVVHR